MNYTQLDDNALVKLIIDEQANALNELYSRYGRLVYSIALQMLGDGAAAEEITIDIFTKVWEKAETYRTERGTVRVWITSMARNRAIDILRRENVRSNVKRQLWAEMSAAPVTVERKPEATVDRHQRQEQLRQAINQLSDKQRDVLALAYFQGYTQSEIAALRNLPLGTVKSQIRAGIQKLRQLLQEDQFN